MGEAIFYLPEREIINFMRGHIRLAKAILFETKIPVDELIVVCSFSAPDRLGIGVRVKHHSIPAVPTGTMLPVLTIDCVTTDKGKRNNPYYAEAYRL